MSLLSPRLIRRPGQARADAGLVPGAAPRIVLVENDPYLAFLIRLNFPRAEVIEADPAADAETVRAMRPDLVIVGVESTTLNLGELLAERPDGLPPKVLGVVDGARAGRTSLPDDFDDVLVRPFVQSELHGVVGKALGVQAPADSTDFRNTRLARARRLIGPARVAAVAVAAVLEILPGLTVRSRALYLALAFAYTTFRALRPSKSPAWLGADIAGAAALVAWTHGVASPYIPYALVVAAGTGLLRDERMGGFAGAVIAATSTPLIAYDLGSQTLGIRETVAWYLLMPLAGVAGGFASRVWGAQIGESTDMLAEANRVLSSLYRIARTIPGGLEMGTVADSALQEMRDTVRSAAGVMMVWEAGTLAVVASYGIRNPDAIAGGAANGLGDVAQTGVRVLTSADFDTVTARALGGHECWLAAPMRKGGAPVGLLLAACPDHDRHNASRLVLQQIAQEGAVAVENARIFSRVRELSIDEERQRLARELHDGVAQALTHLRFELEFMSRHGTATPDAVKREVERLSRVVNRASADVRAMIYGLRSSVSAEGLVGSLRAYLSDLRGLGGPEIVFEARGEVRLSPGVESEIFRIAQEAVSNAIRHAGAAEVKVGIVAGTTKLRLVVEDDGAGLQPRKQSGPAGGVGLQAMRERAQAIGATLEVGARAGGGTAVALEYRPEEG